MRSQLVGVGVALPSPIDPADGRVDPDILATWAGEPAADRFAARFGAPVLVENDANAEAMAELSDGAGRGLRHLIYVKVSWGIGGAVVVNGRLRRGSRHAAGEFAHLQTRGAHRPCRCGRPACLGPMVNGNALREDLRAIHGGALALEEIVQLAGSGDLVARRALDDSGRMLGQALAPVCNALNPGAIIVGGELGVAGSPLLEGVETGLSRATLPCGVGGPSGPPGRPRRRGRRDRRGRARRALRDRGRPPRGAHRAIRADLTLDAGPLRHDHRRQHARRREQGPGADVLAEDEPRPEERQQRLEQLHLARPWPRRRARGRRTRRRSRGTSR